MWDLLANQLSKGTSSTKELVFSLLAKQSDITIGELHRRLLEIYGLKITYQAVRKAVHSLQEVGAVEQVSGKFRLRPRFLFAGKNFFDGLITDLDSLSGHKIILRHDARADFSQFEFSSLFETDNGWGEIALEICKPLPAGQPIEYLGVHSFAWWMLINLGRETSLFDVLQARGYPSRMLFTVDCPLNRWVCEVYKGVQVKAAVIKSTTIAEATSINIIGGRVIQVEYPPALFAKIKSIFEKTPSIDKVKTSQLTALAHAKTRVKLSVFNSPAMAEGLRGLILGARNSSSARNVRHSSAGR